MNMVSCVHFHTNDGLCKFYTFFEKVKVKKQTFLWQQLPLKILFISMTIFVGHIFALQIPKSKTLLSPQQFNFYTPQTNNFLWVYSFCVLKPHSSLSDEW